MPPAAPVKPSATTEAGATARGKAPGLSATVIAAEGTGANAALTARRSVSSGRRPISVERPARCPGPVESSPARRSAAIEIVPVIESGAPGRVSAVVKQHGVIMPIESPMAPSPSKTTPPADSEAEPE